MKLASAITACLAAWLLNTSAAEKPTEWTRLFNGQDLAGWKKTDFAGAGEVEVQDRKIILGTGVALTGINRTNAPYRSNYEVLVEAMKIQGGDFFCGLTFPVKDAHATLIVGGWGGSLVGISSVDHMDASENEFTQYMRFDENKWYQIRLRVTDSKIQAWIGEEKLIDANITGRDISMRPGEIEISVPFGIAAYQTTAAIREVKVRPTPKHIPNIAFIAGRKSHGPGEHDYKQSLQLLMRQLEKEHEFIDLRLHLDGWPTDNSLLNGADAIVLYSDGSDHNERDHPLLLGSRMRVLGRFMERGVGLVCLHYSVFVPAEKAGAQFLDWIGGYFDYQTGNAPNKWYSKIETREYEVFPASAHPINTGIKPFSIREEYYFKIRFPEEKKNLTPILTFDPEKKDWDKVVGWALERPDGGRGFGYTGGHFYKNFEEPNTQRLILNAILWAAKAEDLIKQ